MRFQYRNRLAFSFALGLMVALAASYSCGQQSMNGEWKVIEGKLDGNVVPTNVLGAMSLNINNTSFSATSAGLNSQGTLTANATASPMTITFNINTGADTGRALKGIYFFENNNLKITFSQNDQFPTQFESTPGNKYLQLTYSTSQIAANGRGAGNAAAAQNVVIPPKDGNSGAGLLGTDQ